MRSRRALPLLLAGALLTGCGTTVDLADAPAGFLDQGTGTPDGQVSAPTAPAAGESRLPSYQGQVGGPATTAPLPGSSSGPAGQVPVAGAARVTKPLTVGMILTSTAGAATIGLKLDNTYTE